MDAAERDALASDLAVAITQLGGLLCGMRKYTGASGEDWLHWIDCLDTPTNELGSVFEAALDGEGTYERVLGPGTVASMTGNSEAFRQALVGAIQSVIIQEGRPGAKLSSEDRLWSSDARKIADAVIAVTVTAVTPGDQFIREVPMVDLVAELQRRTRPVVKEADQ